MTSTPTIAGDLKSVQWVVPRFDVTASRFTAQFTAIIRNEINPNQLNIICSVALSGDSYPGAVYGEAGRGYSASSVSPALDIPILDIRFSHVFTNIPTPPLSSLSIHEPATFQLNITVPEVTTSITAEIELSTLQPMAALDYRVIMGTSVACIGNSINYVDSDGDTVPDRLTFDWGICINIYDNVADDNDLIQIVAVAALVDLPVNVNGSTLVGSALLTFGDNAAITPSRTLSNTLTFDIIEPLLSVDPIDSNHLTLSDAGDEVRL